MALRNLYNPNSHAFSMEDIEITHALTLKEDNYSIKHELNPLNGDYKILDKNSNKLIHINNAGELKPSFLHQHIQSKTQEVKDITDAHDTRITRVQNQVNTLSTTTTGHNTRITNLENVISGGSGLSLSNILDVSNDAEEKEIINLSNISSEVVTIAGVPLSVVEGVLTCSNAVHVPEIDADIINCITGGDVQMGKYAGNNEIMLAVRSNDNQIVSNSNAQLVNFSNIDDMEDNISDLQTRVANLEIYNTRLINLIRSISQSLDLKDPEAGVDFNYYGLIPE